jgi:hypothetical protein
MHTDRILNYLSSPHPLWDGADNDDTQGGALIRCVPRDFTVQTFYISSWKAEKLSLFQVIVRRRESLFLLRLNSFRTPEPIFLVWDFLFLVDRSVSVCWSSTLVVYIRNFLRVFSLEGLTGAGIVSWEGPMLLKTTPSQKRRSWGSLLILILLRQSTDRFALPLQFLTDVDWIDSRIRVSSLHPLRSFFLSLLN